MDLRNNISPSDEGQQRYFIGKYPNTKLLVLETAVVAVLSFSHSPSRYIKAGDHIPCHPTLKLLAGRATQLLKDGAAIRPDIDSGIVLAIKSARRWSGSIATNGFAPISSSRLVAIPVPKGYTPA